MLRYLADYKGQVALYFIVILLSVVFGLFSFGMLWPVLQVLFVGKQDITSANSVVAKVTEYVNQVIAEHDKLTALTYAVVIVVFFTILKNLFIYLALRILNPIRNSILRRLRNEMFTKTLSLPIGFFTEERKGDLISRMTNDITEVEISIMSVLESFIREPLTVVLTLTSMLIISVKLTLFLLLFLPVAGIIIGRVGKSLKKPSNLARRLPIAVCVITGTRFSGFSCSSPIRAVGCAPTGLKYLSSVTLNCGLILAKSLQMASPICLVRA